MSLRILSLGKMSPQQPFFESDPMKNSLKLLWLSAAIVGLSACGGGGGDSTPPSPSPPSVPEPAPNPSPNPDPSAEAADKYVGTYLEVCRPSANVREAATGSAAFQNGQSVASKAGAKTLKTTTTIRFYASDDTTCKGPVLASHTNSNPSNTITIDGPGVAFKDGVLVMVDKTTHTIGALDGSISADGLLLLGDLVYPGNFFTRTSSVKGLALLEG